MTGFRVILVLVALTVVGWTAAAPQQQRSPLQLDREVAPEEKPHVAILKQINQINKDGSYTYGFEASDGSFRVETRDIHGNVKGKYGYVDEFGEIKTVVYEAGKPQGFRPHGQHLPPLPRQPASGNVDDEFGTDEDWQSVDADQDGMPDPPRPKDQRTPIVPVARPQPSRPSSTPVFVPAAVAPQPFRQVEASFVPAEAIRSAPQPEQVRVQPQPQSQQFEAQQHQQPQPQQTFREFNGPIFPFQFASPGRVPQQQFQPQGPGVFVPVPFTFQARQPPRE